MSERNDQLKGLIQTGQIDRAIDMVRNTTNYHEGEGFVFTVLYEEKSEPELVEAALEAFLKCRENCYGQHGYWVHSLSHFTELLWERRMDKWIKKFNEVAFTGANELGDSRCSLRLVVNFSRFAKFNDDPADFGITNESLRWAHKSEWEYPLYAYAKKRFDAGRFESEEVFLKWKITAEKSS